MTRLLATTSAIAVAALSSTALADVTPQEVWESWQAMATSAGQELTIGGEVQAGDRLEITDLLVTFKDQLGGSASASFDSLVFADNGDGTVTVTMPDSYPIAMAFPAEGDGPGSMKLTVSQPGTAIVAGGSATETSYDFTMPVARITLDEMTDQAGKVIDAKAEVAMTDAAARYVVNRDGDKTVLDSSFSARSLEMNISGTDPDGQAGGTGKLSLTDITGKTSGNFMSADMMANAAIALRNGFTVDSSFSFGALSANLDITEDTGPTKLTANATGGGFVLEMNKDRLNYGSSLAGAKFVMSTPDIPFPQVEFAFAESAFNLLMPVSKSDEPQDFAFLTKFVDFTVSEDIWGLFDPAGSLSREPATFVLDTKGTGFWNQDIMDPAVDVDTLPDPGQLHSLDLTQFLAKGAGAEVSATGGLTFDNTDTATFDGMPRPDGLIDVNIKGVNKLVENLIALGILTAEDAMGFRMGLAMFARPGAGPDELTSKIEFKDGGVFANGQQLQ